MIKSRKLCDLDIAETPTWGYDKFGLWNPSGAGSVGILGGYCHVPMSIVTKVRKKRKKSACLKSGKWN